MRSFLIGLIWLLLAGCATHPAVVPSSSPTHFQAHLEKLEKVQHYVITGKLGVIATSEYKSFTGQIHWRHDPSQDQVNIFTPLGSTAANISKTPEEVTLTTADGKRITASDAESLTEQAMGWQLPLNGLSDWALGRPANHSYTNAIWDLEGRLSNLQQDGWNIEFSDYQTQSGISLPGKIRLSSKQVRLKLVIDAWQISL